LGESDFYILNKYSDVRYQRWATISLDPGYYSVTICDPIDAYAYLTKEGKQGKHKFVTLEIFHGPGFVFGANCMQIQKIRVSAYSLKPLPVLGSPCWT